MKTNFCPSCKKPTSVTISLSQMGDMADTALGIQENMLDRCSEEQKTRIMLLKNTIISMAKDAGLYQ